MEDGDCEVMRQMIRTVLNECYDFDTLDLVYKILISEGKR